MKNLIIITLAFIIGFFGGFISVKYCLWPARQINSIINRFKIEKYKLERLTDKQVLTLFQKNNPAYPVFLILGQSNAANYGQIKYVAGERVYNYYKGAVYSALDPLLGAGGSSGSCWGRLADLLIRDSVFNEILICPLAQGASSVSDWEEHGRYHKQLTMVMDMLLKRNISINYIIWQQGEQDNLLNKSYKEYKSSLEQIISYIHKKSPTSKILISITSYNPLNNMHPIDAEIRQAQQEIINYFDYVYSGPDTDELISPGDRYDGIHFSRRGMDKLVEKWNKAIIQAKDN